MPFICFLKILKSFTEIHILMRNISTAWCLFVSCRVMFPAVFKKELGFARKCSPGKRHMLLTSYLLFCLHIGGETGYF